MFQTPCHPTGSPAKPFLGIQRRIPKEARKEKSPFRQEGPTLSEPPRRGQERELRVRSGVGCPSGTPGAKRQHGRRHALTHALLYWRRRGSSRVHQQCGPSGRDAAGLSVIRCDRRRPGERGGAGRERVVRLTSCNQRKMGEALALSRPWERGVCQGRPHRESRAGP